MARRADEDARRVTARVGVRRETRRATGTGAAATMAAVGAAAGAAGCAEIVGFGRGSLRQLRPHLNPGLEIVYVLRGTLLWQAEGRAEVVRPRSVFFSLPWQEHGSLLEFEPGHEWCYVILRLGGPADRVGGARRPGLGTRRVRFPRSLGLDEASERSIARTLVGSRRHGSIATDALAWVLPTLVEELGSPGTLHRERVRSLARLAVVELARSLERPSDRGSESRVAALIATLSDGCDRPWTLAEMAERCGVGRTRLAELLRLWTGDTPTQLLNRLRVERARRLLAETDDPVTRIAHACGFETSQYFARVFRRFSGCDASGYRASRRSGGPTPGDTGSNRGEAAAQRRG